MIGKTRGIGRVVVVLAATCLVPAAAEDKPAAGKPEAERMANDTKPSPAASGKDDAPVAPYEDTESIPSPAGGCCGGPALVPICRCVPKTKKTPKTEYEVECELVCVPVCGKHLFGKRHSGCAGCCEQACCDHASIRTKKTLLKKIVEKEEDAWEYKVEWVCAGCGTGCCSAGDCATPPRAMHVRAWHAVQGFWHGLFHRR